MKASLVFPTFNHAPLLRRTLASIFRQRPSIELEVIVVNDGSTDGTDSVLAEFPVKVIELPQKSHHRNPGGPTNVGFRAATGDIILQQSDDTVHGSMEVIQGLCDALQPKTWVAAGVKPAVPVDGLPPEEWPAYVDYMRHANSPFMHAPLCFLGAFWREDLYAVGGYDERFGPVCADDWLADCLIHRGLRKIERDDLLTYHQRHDRGRRGPESDCWKLLHELRTGGVFHTADAPWPLTQSHENGLASSCTLPP